MNGVSVMERKSNRKGSIERKVVKMGNAVGVNIPAEIMKDLSLELGDKLEVTVENDTIVLKKKPKEIQLPNGISEDFFKVLEKTMTKYDSALRNLIGR